VRPLHAGRAANQALAPHRAGSCAGIHKVTIEISPSPCSRDRFWITPRRIQVKRACVVLPCLTWSLSWFFVFEGCGATLSNPLPRGQVTANWARRPLRSAPSSVGGLGQVIAMAGQKDNDHGATQNEVSASWSFF
jgi:hypothetical protein